MHRLSALASECIGTSSLPAARRSLCRRHLALSLGPANEDNAYMAVSHRIRERRRIGGIGGMEIYAGQGGVYTGGGYYLVLPL